MEEFNGTKSKLSLADKLLIDLFATADVNFSKRCFQDDLPVTPDEILRFFLTDHNVSPS
jgi:hypothetical protein